MRTIERKEIYDRLYSAISTDETLLFKRFNLFDVLEVSVAEALILIASAATQSRHETADDIAYNLAKQLKSVFADKDLNALFELTAKEERDN